MHSTPGHSMHCPCRLQGMGCSRASAARHLTSRCFALPFSASAPLQLHPPGPSPPVAASPLQVTISLLEAAMDASSAQHFLIDGFPRNEENRASFESQVGMGSVYGGG